MACLRSLSFGGLRAAMMRPCHQIHARRLSSRCFALSPSACGYSYLALAASYSSTPKQWCSTPATGAELPLLGFLSAYSYYSYSPEPSSSGCLDAGHLFHGSFPDGFRRKGECGPGHGRGPLCPSLHVV